VYFLYSVLLTIGFVALLPRFLFDVVRHGKYAAGFHERMGWIPSFDAQGKSIIWLHCVSVGETQAARPLVRALLERYPSHALVVSTITLTGQQIAREIFAHDVVAAVFYFPFDWRWTVRRALRAINPSAVLILETELWPNFLRECRAQSIPVALINGRISEKSFRRYQLIRPFINRVLNQLTMAIMQTEADVARITALGLAPERLKISGNIKFDAHIETSAQALTDELRERFEIDDASFLIVAASTHQPEERIVLEAFQKLRTTMPKKRIRLLIAPRHPERFAEVAALLASSGINWSRRTKPPVPTDAQSDCILLDSIGELRAVYPLATLVFVGGSISRTGGHNVLEPAHYAKCIVTGAHTFNFTSIVREFLQQEALVQLPDVSESEAPQHLTQVFEVLLRDGKRRRSLGEKARSSLRHSRGATERTVKMLTDVLDSTFSGRE
jgi:3-deoxy-D-manno-octulosonic-acid transferase